MNENEFDIREDYEFRLCTAIDDVEKDPERVPAVYVRERFGSRQEYVILGAEFLTEDEQDLFYLNQTYYVSSDASALESVIFIDCQTPSASST